MSSLEDEHRKRLLARLEKEFKAKADAFLPKLETQKVGDSCAVLCAVLR